MVRSLARFSKNSHTGFALVLALTGVVLQPHLPARRSQEPSPGQRAKVEKVIKLGAEAVAFRQARSLQNPKLRERLAHPRLHHSINFENFSVTSLRRTRSTSVGSLIARASEVIFGQSSVEARGPQDCDVFLNEVKYTAGAAAALGRLSRSADCTDIEEINIYSDSFESGIHVAGSMGLSTSIEIVMESETNYYESEIEFNLPIVQNEEDDFVVDPSLVAEVTAAAEQSIGAAIDVLAGYPGGLLWWIFSDDGYGHTDEFLSSGLPCDQKEDINGWINHEALTSVFSYMNVTFALVGAAAQCSALVIIGLGLTFWAWSACVTGSAVQSLVSQWLWQLAWYGTAFYLDCVLDVIGPKPGWLPPAPNGIPSRGF